MKKFVIIILAGCTLLAGSVAWAAPDAQGTGNYLADLQGSVQGITLDSLKKAPATLSVEACTFRLTALISANLMPPVPAWRTGEVALTVSEVNRKPLPEGARLDFLWLVQGDRVWFRDLRQVPERPWTERWYTFEKSVNDAPASFAHGQTMAVVGIRTGSGQVLLLRGSLEKRVVY